MRSLLLMTCLLLSACWSQEIMQPTLYPAGFDHLPGWAEDQHAEAYAALAASCRTLAASKAAWEQRFTVTGGEGMRVTSDDLRAVCKALPASQKMDDEAARAFFEAHFAPYLLTRDGWPARCPQPRTGR